MSEKNLVGALFLLVSDSSVRMYVLFVVRR